MTGPRGVLGSKNMRRVALRLLVGLGCLAAVPACLSAVPTTARPPATTGAAPASGAREVFETRCGRCHVLSTIKRYKKTPRQWERTINRMRTMGVQVSDDEMKALLDYLAPPAEEKQP